MVLKRVTPIICMTEPRKRKYAYSTRRKLGSGAFAEVFLGSMRDDENAIVKMVAVKRIDKSKLADNPRIERLLQNEISLLRVLSGHPNVVELFDSFEDAKHLHLVLEYCDGGDLGQYLRKNAPLSEGSTHDILQQIVEGVKHTRTNHIVHRDIKPQNVLLERSKTHASGFCVKLTDFGFATRLQVGDMATTFCGSPLHMAPELLTGNQYDPKIDLWSLGTIAYQMVTGSTPYRAQNIKELKQKLREQEGKPLPLPKHTHDNLADLIQRLLCLDPRSRIDFEDLYNHPFIVQKYIRTEASPAMSYIMMAPPAGDAKAALTESLLDHQGSFVMVDQKAARFGEQVEKIGGKTPNQEEKDDVRQTVLRKMAEDVVNRATLIMYVGNQSSQWERLALYGHALMLLRDASLQAQGYLRKSSMHTRKTIAMAYRFRDCMEHCMQQIDELKEVVQKSAAPEREEMQGIIELLVNGATELDKKTNACQEGLSESLYRDAITLLKIAREGCSEPTRREQIAKYMASIERRMNSSIGSEPALSTFSGDSRYLTMPAKAGAFVPPATAPIDIPNGGRSLIPQRRPGVGSYERARFCGGCGLRYGGSIDLYCPMCGTQRAMITSSTPPISLSSI